MPFVTVNGKTARMEDVSRTGLKVHTDVDALPGARFLLTIAGCPSLSARLIWKRDGVMGLEAPMVSMSLPSKTVAHPEREAERPVRPIADNLA